MSLKIWLVSSAMLGQHVSNRRPVSQLDNFKITDTTGDFLAGSKPECYYVGLGTHRHCEVSRYDSFIQRSMPFLCYVEIQRYMTDFPDVGQPSSRNPALYSDARLAKDPYEKPYLYYHKATRQNQHVEVL